MRLLSLTFPSNKRAERCTAADQFFKIKEEYEELMDAELFGDGDPIEEAIDTMIAIDGWLDKQPEEEVRAAISRVRRKGTERGDWEVRDD